jgi:beta-galactosidase
MGNLSIGEGTFLLDGEPFRIISGAIHYFRILPEYWKDRVKKARLCGLNTVETYIPWNLHEPRPGQYCFDRRIDLEAFIQTVADEGLNLILRPGPYICAEWEFGGLPAWLLKDRSMRLRCMYQPYIEAVDRYFDELIPRLAKYQSTKGGPLIAVQVENEYGSYGSDTAYLGHLNDGLKARGIDVLPFTSDGPTSWMLTGGTLPESAGVLPTVNFGSKAIEAFECLDGFTPHRRIPHTCMEFWNGWFDHWGEEHHTRGADDAAQALDEILAAGGSVNFYMFSGGTNFGFVSGSNFAAAIQPTITSYDYDAALGETGEPSDKFHAFRSIIAKYESIPNEALPEAAPRAAYGSVELTESAALLENLVAASQDMRRSPVTLSMEDIDQDYGFILYRTQVSGPREDAVLHIQDVHDRALVIIDGDYRGIIERGVESTIRLSIPAAQSIRLDILVENLGRINYGPHLADRKGITEGVRLGNQFLYTWEHYPLPLEPLPDLSYVERTEVGGPAFYRGFFDSETPADTFLEFDGWAKGVCFINGFNLGRYWEIGPQRTLYIPAALLRQGPNEVVMFELHGYSKPDGKPSIDLKDSPDLG